MNYFPVDFLALFNFISRYLKRFIIYPILSIICDKAFPSLSHLCPTFGFLNLSWVAWQIQKSEVAIARPSGTSSAGSALTDAGFQWRWQGTTKKTSLTCFVAGCQPRKIGQSHSFANNSACSPSPPIRMSREVTA